MGSKQKKPPLIHCSDRGFSLKPRTTPSPLRWATPKGSRGRTTVMVAGAPCRVSAWAASSAARSMSATPSP